MQATQNIPFARKNKKEKLKRRSETPLASIQSLKKKVLLRTACVGSQM